MTTIESAVAFPVSEKRTREERQEENANKAARKKAAQDFVAMNNIQDGDSLQVTYGKNRKNLKGVCTLSKNRRGKLTGITLGRITVLVLDRIYEISLVKRKGESD